MIYLIIWVAGYLMLGLAVRWPKCGKTCCVLAVLMMGALAGLRGNVGTDTAAYQVLSSLIREHGIWAVGVEPGFAALFLLFQSMGLTDVFVVRALAAVDVLLLFFYVRRSSDDERYFLLAVFLPAFFYSYAMNEMRIGLVSIVYLLIYQLIGRCGKIRWWNSVPVVATLALHYTAIFYPIFTCAVLKSWSRRLVFLIGLVLAGGVVFVMLLTPGHVMEKFRLYSAYPAPSRLSGLSSVVQAAIMMFAVYHSSLSCQIKKRFIVVSTGLVIFSLGVVQVTYAGLRMLDLVVYAGVITVLFLHNAASVRLNRKVKLCMLCFGLFSVAFVFRNFLNESADSYSPFLPYHTFF